MSDDGFFKGHIDEDLIEEIEQIINTNFDDLSNWEIDFLESISGQLQDGRKLTSKQEDVLDRIFEKVN